MNQPLYGLLADVDGPLSNPDAKAVINPLIFPALHTLLEHGVPVVLNTGRPSQFVKQNVLAPLLALSPKNLHLLHAVCEKGALWFSVNDDGRVTEHIDEEITVPSDLADSIRELVRKTYADTMFFDEMKQTMISVERNPD